jgi:hypothetical protein
VASVVFTRQAIDGQGNLILRADLAAKAKKAAATGIPVKIYPEFLGMLDGVTSAYLSNEKPNACTDPVVVKMSAAAKQQDNRAPFLAVGNVL